jgi:hypothetical protein
LIYIYIILSRPPHVHIDLSYLENKYGYLDNFSVEEIQPEELMTDEQLQAMENNVSPVKDDVGEVNEL